MAGVQSKRTAAAAAAADDDDDDGNSQNEDDDTNAGQPGGGAPAGKKRRKRKKKAGGQGQGAGVSVGPAHREQTVLGGGNPPTGMGAVAQSASVPARAMHELQLQQRAGGAGASGRAPPLDQHPIQRPVYAYAAPLAPPPPPAMQGSQYEADYAAWRADPSAWQALPPIRQQQERLQHPPSPTSTMTPDCMDEQWSPQSPLPDNFPSGHGQTAETSQTPAYAEMSPLSITELAKRDPEIARLLTQSRTAISDDDFQPVDLQQRASLFRTEESEYLARASGAPRRDSAVLRARGLAAVEAMKQAAGHWQASQKD